MRRRHLRLVMLTIVLTFFFAPFHIDGLGSFSLGPQDALAAGCDPLYDLDSDADVDDADISLLAGKWGSTQAGDLALDANNNGRIDVADIVYGTLQGCSASVQPFAVTVQNGSTDNVQTLAATAGIRWIRFGKSWKSIERNNVDLTDPNNGDWPDSVFREFESHGLSPIFLVMTNPNWAAPTACGPLYADKYSDFREFIYAAAARYDGDADYNDDGTVDGDPMPNIRFWEFFNEPDLNPNKLSYDFGGCWGNAGSEYAKLMREAYLAIKGAPATSSASTVADITTLTGANPSATVMLGGLAYDSQYNNPDTPTSNCYNWQSQNFMNYYFLEDILGTTFGDGTTGGDYFDTVNFHYHRKASPCWEPWGKEALGKANYLQTRLADYGYNGVTKPRKTMAVTEDGEKRAPFPDYTDEEQARYVVMSFARALAGEFEVHTWFSFDYFTDHLGRVFGLLDQNYNKKPGYNALDVLTEKLSGAQFDGNLGVAGIEGYRFDVNGVMKTVAWTSSGARSVPFVGSQIRAYNKYGSLLTQGSGTLNVTISTDPVYIEVTP